MYEIMAKLNPVAIVNLRTMSITASMLRSTAFFAIILVIAGCAEKERDPVDGGVTALYGKAGDYADNHEYEKALELLQEGLAKDTLDGFSGKTAEALNRKRRIEEATGNYFDALATHDILEKRCKGMLPQAVEEERIRSKASLLAELGEFDSAGKALKDIASLSVRDSLQLARYHELAGEKEKAFSLYNELCRNTGPLLALRACSGLLQMSLGGGVREVKKPSVYARRVTEIARELITQGSEGSQQAASLSLRRAAGLLELLPAHAKDASYLYYKALSLARAAGDRHLAQLLDFESNAVLNNDPEVYARTLDYFERNNMGLARMAALLKQGSKGMIDDREKIKALKHGLNIYQHQVSPWPGYAIAELVDRSAQRLTELLLDKGRYAEAFESDELRKLYELRQAIQRDYGSFDLPEQHDQLERQVVRLDRELSALLQRLANCFESGEGFEHHATTIESINKKRGLLYELLAEVRNVAPLQAAKLTAAPTTLRTVQETLDDGHAALKIIEGRDWCTVFLVQNNYVDVSRRRVEKEVYRSRVRLFKERLSINAGRGSVRFALDSERLWLTDLLIKPHSRHLRDIRRLTVIADDPFPVHLLGINRYLVRDFPVSGVYSASELVRLASTTRDEGTIPVFNFFSVDGYREAIKQKSASPDHVVFLLWKAFSAAELEELRVLLALSMQKGENPSDVLHQLAQQQKAGNDNQWLYVSEYGVSGR